MVVSALNHIPNRMLPLVLKTISKGLNIKLEYSHNHVEIVLGEDPTAAIACASKREPGTEIKRCSWRQEWESNGCCIFKEQGKTVIIARQGGGHKERSPYPRLFSPVQTIAHLCQSTVAEKVYEKPLKHILKCPRYRKVDENATVLPCLRVSGTEKLEKQPKLVRINCLWLYYQTLYFEYCRSTLNTAAYMRFIWASESSVALENHSIGSWRRERFPRSQVPLVSSERVHSCISYGSVVTPYTSFRGSSRACHKKFAPIPPRGISYGYRYPEPYRSNLEASISFHHRHWKQPISTRKPPRIQSHLCPIPIP